MNANKVIDLIALLRDAPDSLFGATADFLRRCNGEKGAEWQRLHQSVVDAGLGAVVTKAIVAPAAPSNIITADEARLVDLVAFPGKGWSYSPRISNSLF